MVGQAAEQDAVTRIASKLFAAMDWLVPVPAYASPQERRSYHVAAIGYPAGTVVHILFIFLFAYWEIPALALFNIFSVLIWLLSLLSTRKNHLELGYALVIIELVIHQMLVVYFVGWGMGMQYFLVVAMVTVALISWPFWIRVAAVVPTTAIFIFLYFYARDNMPQVTVNPAQLDAAYIVLTSLFFLILAAFIFYGVGTADQLEAQLEVEHEKSEALLNNILPEPISDRLKNDGGTIADHCEEASILFADVVDFTPMSATMTPAELVELLNDVFSDFDVLTEKFGLEKIKTIGDCYMVASGVPQPRADHAQVLTQLALEMQERVNNHQYNGHKLAFRIGINSGPVVAGVIGRKKFAYDLWGDAVNTASRMESNGKEGCVQITEATYELIKEDFVCEAQGTVDVKGKGVMDVWYVTGVRPERDDPGY